MCLLFIFLIEDTHTAAYHSGICHLSVWKQQEGVWIYIPLLWFVDFTWQYCLVFLPLSCMLEYGKSFRIVLFSNIFDYYFWSSCTLLWSFQISIGMALASSEKNLSQPQLVVSLQFCFPPFWCIPYWKECTTSTYYLFLHLKSLKYRWRNLGGPLLHFTASRIWWHFIHFYLFEYWVIIICR